MKRLTLTAALLLPLWSVPASGQATASPQTPVGQSTDSAAVVAAVDAFHAALESGDTAAVRRLLTPDVLVQEGGGLEDRSEYLSHHLPADMTFAAAVAAQRQVRRVAVRGDVAWVASTSHRVGTFRGRAIDSEGAELMVLERRSEGWRIAAIHWSSRSS